MKKNKCNILENIHIHYRSPSFPESLRCLLLAVGLIFGATTLGASIQFGIILAAAASFLMSRRLGYTWVEMEEVIGKRLGELSNTMLIMWMIGFLLGTMLYSRLLPMLVYLWVPTH